MGEQDQTNSSSYTTEFQAAQTPADPQSQRSPYHRPHISQEPIDDIPTEYVMPNRYTTVEQASAPHGRRNMGVASNDPDYLPRTPGPARDGSEAPTKVRQPKTSASAFTYDRYLQTPKSGKSIFTSRQRRRQKRLHRVVAVAAVAAVVALIIALFVL